MLSVLRTQQSPLKLGGINVLGTACFFQRTADTVRMREAEARVVRSEFTQKFSIVFFRNRKLAPYENVPLYSIKQLTVLFSVITVLQGVLALLQDLMYQFCSNHYYLLTGKNYARTLILCLLNRQIPNFHPLLPFGMTSIDCIHYFITLSEPINFFYFY